MDTVGRKVVELRIEDVLPNRFQPRIKFNEEAINELSKSIKEHGVIQPIVVRPIGDKYEIIAGERRYKASCMAELPTIPAIITDLNDKDSAEVALIENVQRENLTPIEEAISYKKILDMGYITQDALATKLGKTQSTVANKLRLLNLDDEVQEALLNEKISERHARSLLKLNDKTKQKELLNRIISERLTVRKTDDEIEKILNGNSNIEENKTSFINNQEETGQIIPTIENPIQDKNNIQEQQTSKFINIPIENVNNESREKLELDTEESENLENQEEIKPAKFFNILNDEEPEHEAPKETPKEPIFNFDNLFNNQSASPIETVAQNNNALLEELNEIEKSIKNSTLEEIHENTQAQEEKTPKFFEIPKAEEQKEPEEIKETIDDDELDFIEEFEEEPETEKKSTINESITSSTNLSNLKDVIQYVRDSSEKIENSGFRIDVEEIDLENEYQIIMKIEK